MAYIPSEKAEKLIKKYCGDKPNVTLTVGVLKNGEKTYLTYNGNGELISSDGDGKRLYEIGSITKTFTAALFSKMVYDGKTESHASIGPYIGAKNNGRCYPTLDRLATHTSGLGRAPISTTSLLFKAIIGKGRLSNIYSGFDGKKMEKALIGLNLEPTDYPTQYTHYGFGALGYVLGKIDGRGYKTAIEELIHNDLGLENTFFGMPEGRCEGGYSSKNTRSDCWVWTDKDAMAGSDCLSSCAEDMLKYAEICMSGKYKWLDDCLEPHSEYDDVDDFGYGFIIRASNGIAWHNGSTGAFASFFAFDRKSGDAVVLLSDYEHIKGEFSVDKIGFEIISPKEEKEKKHRNSDDSEYDDYEPYVSENGESDGSDDR